MWRLPHRPPAAPDRLAALLASAASPAHVPRTPLPSPASACQPTHGWVWLPASTATCSPAAALQVLLALEPARALLLKCAAVLLDAGVAGAAELGGAPGFAAWARAVQQFRGLNKKQLRSRAAWQSAERQVLPSLCAFAQQAERCAGEQRQRQQKEEAELRAARALVLHACASPGCTNVLGASEARLHGRRCGGGCGARFCSEACRDAAWPLHARVCGELAAAGRLQG